MNYLLRLKSSCDMHLPRPFVLSRWITLDRGHKSDLFFLSFFIKTEFCLSVAGMKQLVTVVRVISKWSSIQNLCTNAKPNMLRNWSDWVRTRQTQGFIYRVEWKWPYLLMPQWPLYHRFNPTVLAVFWNSELTVSQRWKEVSNPGRSVTRQLFLSIGYSFNSQQTLHELSTQMYNNSKSIRNGDNWKFDYCTVLHKQSRSKLIKLTCKYCFSSRANNHL